MTRLKVCPATTVVAAAVATFEPQDERREAGAEAETIWARQNPHEDRREQDWSEQLQAVSVSEKQSSSVEQSELVVVVESRRLLVDTVALVRPATVGIVISGRVSESVGLGPEAVAAAAAAATAAV